MKLKRRVLASIMSILILSSFFQLTGFAADGQEVDSHPMFGKTKADNLDILAIQGVQDLIVNDDADLEKLKTIEKFVKALGTDSLASLIKEQNYNIEVKFGKMESNINAISDQLSITEWDCEKENHITITNNSGNDIKAHIGVEFDEKCGITGISLANYDELASIDLANKASQKSTLQLSGGQIQQNANLAVLNNFSTNNLIQIGVAKVFITSGSFIESSKAIASKLQEYGVNTKAFTDKMNDKEIKTAGITLFEIANSLPTAVEETSNTYTESVNAFVTDLKANGGNLKKVKTSLPDCQDLNKKIAGFINANEKLTEKVKKNITP